MSLYSQTKKPVVHKHIGFYERTSAGLGYTSMSESVGSTTIDMKGFSIDVNEHVGYSVAENFALYGVVGYNIMPSPKYKLNGQEVTTTASSRLSLIRMGIGATYYFMPINIFGSIDFAGAKNQVETMGATANSDWGYIVNISAGKEWWVAKKWGVGAMLYFYTGSINDVAIGTTTPTISNTGFGASFVATFN
jgi:hypothetical protein